MAKVRFLKNLSPQTGEEPMIKWGTNWSEAKVYRSMIGANGGTLVWAVEMPKTYPECRVTTRGIAHIAVTNDEFAVTELREDGGYVRLLP
jgi:hypothetical protein